MTKDEVISEAKRLGLKVRENFMDDWLENLLILLAGGVLGFILKWSKLIF